MFKWASGKDREGVVGQRLILPERENKGDKVSWYPHCNSLLSFVRNEFIAVLAYRSVPLAMIRPLPIERNKAMWVHLCRTNTQITISVNHSHLYPIPFAAALTFFYLLHLLSIALRKGTSARVADDNVNSSAELIRHVDTPSM